MGKVRRERIGAKLTLPQIFLLAYVLWSCLSAVLSPYSGLFIGQSRYEGVASILLYSAAFLLLSFWGEYTDAYVYGLGGMGALLGYIAMRQSFGATMLYPGDTSYWNTHFLTTIGHEDCVAGIICILVPVLLCGYVILEGKQRWLCLPGLFFLTYIMVFTDVDTAKIGFMIVPLMLPCLIESRERLRKLLIGMIPILLGLALGYAYHRDRSFAPGAAALVFLLAAVALVLGFGIGKILQNVLRKKFEDVMYFNVFRHPVSLKMREKGWFPLFADKSTTPVFSKKRMDYGLGTASSEELAAYADAQAAQPEDLPEAEN